MIATLDGQVSQVLADSLILELGGIGYEVRLPVPDLAKIKDGQKLRLFIHDHLKEDAHELYGFTNADAKALFVQLISVSGVGPKMAMAMLSAVPAEQIKAAITTDEVDVLQSVSGVGRRTAARIVADLKHKVDGGGINLSRSAANDPAYEALVQLGYSAAQARKAVAAVPANSKSDQERIKLALKEVGK